MFKNYDGGVCDTLEIVVLLNRALCEDHHLLMHHAVKNFISANLKKDNFSTSICFYVLKTNVMVRGKILSL